MPSALTLRTPTRAEVRRAYESPLGQLLLRIGYNALITALKSASHPAAKVAVTLLVALTSLDRFPDARRWALKELPKLARELKKLEKTHPDWKYARMVVQQTIGIVKNTATT